MPEVISVWSEVWSFTPDVSPPDIPNPISTAVRTSTQLDITWAASSDNGGVGGVTYDVASAPDGSTWTPECTGISTRICSKGGLAAGQKVFWRVRSTDALGWQSAWTYYENVTEARSQYNFRTSVASTTLPSAPNMQATVASAGANTNSSVSYAGNTGWFPFEPNVTLSTTTNGASEPADTAFSATGTGWIVEAYPGNSAPRSD